jgi:hypothetical protein
MIVHACSNVLDSYAATETEFLAPRKFAKSLNTDCMLPGSEEKPAY